MASRDSRRARIIRIAILSVGVAMAVLWHGVWLYSFSVIWEHAALPSALIGGTVLVVVVKHVGLAGAGYAWLRRHFRAGKDTSGHTP